jgi:hypothetical protein
MRVTRADRRPYDKSKISHPLAEVDVAPTPRAEANETAAPARREAEKVRLLIFIGNISMTEQLLIVLEVA